MSHHALGEKALERFLYVEPTDALQRPRPEACVKEVEDRMLDPAYILADREPAFRHGAVERPVVGLTGESNEIPARIHQRIEHVGLSPGDAVHGSTTCGERVCHYG